jgi:hypothetical protein
LFTSNQMGATMTEPSLPEPEAERGRLYAQLGTVGDVG